MKDEALKLALEALLDLTAPSKRARAAITAIKQALAAPVQEPVSMRMPKVGDKVVCIEDESLGTVVYLTAGGSPEIKFDDGSHGTYMLREFAELFGYTTPPAAPVQEPVAWATMLGSYAHVSWGKDRPDYPIRYEVPLYTTPQPAPVQERVDCCANCLRPEHEHQEGKCPKPFTTIWHAWDYDFPPAAQRQFVGLTDEEIQAEWLLTPQHDKAEGVWFGRRLEAKLKEKNT